MRTKLIIGLLSLVGIIVYHECTSGAPLNHRILRYFVAGISLLTPAFLSMVTRRRNYIIGLGLSSLAAGTIFYFFELGSIQNETDEVWKMTLQGILLFSVASFVFMAWVESVAFICFRLGRHRV
jgi:hypothetical protein